ncbi:hypothetical protein [Fructilactobacillus fructivorans]|uniref:Uncharacterized protein n=1 Tax=Fructilactobacillus fructivorans TaxID=1614 RepID=A0AAE6TWC7_9LACO|nr:hypothetical protein [Fructilactobacillus fructivorans]KRK58813.1 hypothetical protein FC73_GL000368 [Fructilactobacillus fructivorans]KRN39574.1 hypothetical protein IV51_GL000941 [Fructilactobacillus fructivorans]KRN43293.1 hypothetical protein IV48_GL000525 [Fructilactobacillus fructivorans]QFX92806.1 hypothetical protein LF543_04190 [Fructilactobacillus fructivorans]RDV65601.1 hypothetical protein DXU76_00220 [Fructilactobacillus fructivorans]
MFNDKKDDQSNMTRSQYQRMYGDADRRHNVEYDHNSENQETRYNRSKKRNWFSRLFHRSKNDQPTETNFNQYDNAQPDSYERERQDASEYKRKRLGRRLNVVILILLVLIIIVLAIMRFVG